MPRRRTLQEVVAICKENGFEVLDANYKQNKIPIRVKCCQKGHVTYKKFNCIQQGDGCIECSPLKPTTIEDCRTAAIKRSGRLISQTIVNSRTKVEWECAKQHRFWCQPTHVINRKIWCPVCAFDHIRIPFEIYEAYAKEKGGTIARPEGVLSAHKRYDWQCKEGHTFKMGLGAVKAGHWCIHCYNLRRNSIKNNKAQHEVFDLVKSICPDAEYNVAGLLASKGLELDVYIPSQKKAIELDGEHWHSQPDTIERDVRKNQQAVEAGIVLLRIGYKAEWFRTNRPIGEAKVREFCA